MTPTEQPRQTFATQALANLRPAGVGSESFVRLYEYFKSVATSATHFVLGVADEDIQAFTATAKDAVGRGYRLPYPSMTLSFVWGKMKIVALATQLPEEVAFNATFAMHGGLHGDYWLVLPTIVDVRDGGYVLHSPADGTVQTQDDKDKINNFVGPALNYLLALLGALSCTNVRAETYHVAPPAKINERRAREGKPPLFETKTLTIHVNPRTPNAHQSFGGGHASPRQHLRRGHIRRLETGKNVWVQPHVVGDSSKGSISKTYRVTT